MSHLIPIHRVRIDLQLVRICYRTGLAYRCQFANGGGQPNFADSLPALCAYHPSEPVSPLNGPASSGVIQPP
jgi:hypothetical protein